MTTLHDPRHHPGRDHRRSRQAPVRPSGDDPPVTAGAEASADLAQLVRGERLALTVSEAGALIGISRALAYELVARGELPSIRLGRRLVVPKLALLRLLGLAPAEG